MPAYTLKVTTSDGRVLKTDTFADYDTAKGAFTDKVAYVESDMDYGREKSAPLTEVATPKGEGGDATTTSGSENYMDVIQETDTKAPPTPVKTDVKWSYEKSNPLYSGGSKPTATMKRTKTEQQAYEAADEAAHAAKAPVESKAPVQAKTSPVTKVMATTKDANFQKGLTAAVVVGGLYYLSTK